MHCLNQQVRPFTSDSLSQSQKAEGGRVEDKIPIKGYLLADLGTPEAERLKSSWANKPDRPERFLVPYQWVNACRASGKVLVQLFREENEAITFHIHESIANPIYRQELHDRILVSAKPLNLNRQLNRVFPDSFLVEMQTFEWKTRLLYSLIRRQRSSKL